MGPRDGNASQLNLDLNVTRPNGQSLNLYAFNVAGLGRDPVFIVSPDAQQNGGDGTVPGRPPTVAARYGEVHGMSRACDIVAPRIQVPGAAAGLDIPARIEMPNRPSNYPHADFNTELANFNAELQRNPGMNTAQLRADLALLQRQVERGSASYGDSAAEMLSRLTNSMREAHDRPDQLSDLMGATASDRQALMQRRISDVIHMSTHNFGRNNEIFQEGDTCAPTSTVRTLAQINPAILAQRLGDMSHAQAIQTGNPNEPVMYRVGSPGSQGYYVHQSFMGSQASTTNMFVGGLVNQGWNQEGRFFRMDAPDSQGHHNHTMRLGGFNGAVAQEDALGPNGRPLVDANGRTIQQDVRNPDMRPEIFQRMLGRVGDSYQPGGGVAATGITVLYDSHMWASHANHDSHFIDISSSNMSLTERLQQCGGAAIVLGDANRMFGIRGPNGQPLPPGGHASSLGLDSNGQLMLSDTNVGTSGVRSEGLMMAALTARSNADSNAYAEQQERTRGPRPNIETGMRGARDPDNNNNQTRNETPRNDNREREEEQQRAEGRRRADQLLHDTRATQARYAVAAYRNLNLTTHLTDAEIAHKVGFGDSLT
jgi:hypothetical protein